LDQISRGFKSMEESYSEAVGWFGEIPKDMSPEEFFGTISKFIECIAVFITILKLLIFVIGSRKVEPKGRRRPY
jgi:hypothetical protein